MPRGAATTATTPRRRADPRVVQTERAVFAATLALIQELGPAGLTIEAIAARSGVARSTIYRRWGDVDELYLEAFDAFTRAPARPTPTGDLRADLTRFATDYAAELNDERFFAVLLFLMDASLRSRAYRTRYRAITAARQRRVAALARAAATAGAAPEGLDAPSLADAVMAPLFHARVARHRRIEDADVTAAVRDALAEAGVAVPPPTARRRPAR
jgi:AcrR family transcriptional regulator